MIDPNDPDYLALQAQLKSAVATAESLNETIATQSERIRQLRAELDNANAQSNLLAANADALQAKVDRANAVLFEQGLPRV
jgi:uncharacterized coiled-coil DUF342 family protein